MPATRSRHARDTARHRSRHGATCPRHAHDTLATRPRHGRDMSPIGWSFRITISPLSGGIPPAPVPPRPRAYTLRGRLGGHPGENR
eukprot:6746307-Prymnesium_polylepis.1